MAPHVPYRARSPGRSPFSSVRLTVPLIAAVLLIASALTGLIQAPGASAASTRGPSILDPPEIARGAPTGMHGPGQSRQAPEAPPSTNAPYTVGYLPISRLVTEDVDLVEVAAASGTILYDLTLAIPTIVAQTQLPGTPARRDIDPIIVGGGSHVIYATGTEIHCIAYPSGAIVWTLPLPSPVVEAVDPVVTKVEDRLIVPTEGYVTIYDISLINAPVFLSSYFLGTTLVREVDARLAAGDAICYMPAKGGLFVFSAASGMQITTIPLQSPLIEGNDMEIDPTGTLGFLSAAPSGGRIAARRPGGSLPASVRNPHHRASIIARMVRGALNSRGSLSGTQASERCDQ